MMTREPVFETPIDHPYFRCKRSKDIKPLKEICPLDTRPRGIQAPNASKLGEQAEDVLRETGPFEFARIRFSEQHGNYYPDLIAFVNGPRLCVEVHASLSGESWEKKIALYCYYGVSVVYICFNQYHAEKFRRYGFKALVPFEVQRPREFGKLTANQIKIIEKMGQEILDVANN